MFQYDHEIRLFLSRMVRMEQPYKLSPLEEQTMNQKLAIFNDLVGSFSLESGEELSLKERECLAGIPDITLTYGEIDFVSICEIFYTINNRYGGLPSGIFYDLGSGMGKAVVAAAMCGQFTVCRGIEILNTLYSISEQVKQKYNRDMPDIIRNNKHLFTKFVDIELSRGNMFDFNWSDASIVFANSTCFGTDMMRRIGSAPLNVGTIGISFTEIYLGDGWIILESIRKTMSWGQATVYIQRYVGSQNINRVRSNF